MPERRYDEDEVAAIFLKAAEGPQSTAPQSSRSDGMTLAELQDIGREVGISPEAVASAAKSVELRATSGGRTILGMPIGVSRSVELGRRLSESEWEHLVVELREVFNARGAVSAYGSFRQWTNGNLQALLEPTPTGHRLRISTQKGTMATTMIAGVALIAAGSMAAIGAGIAGHLGAAAVDAAVFLGAGIGTIVVNAVRLPAWARLRGRQMEAITSRIALESSADSSNRIPPTT
ncbi:MAG: hypothetical protein ABI889_09625 [Gemmatimonadota bacterium]